MYFKLYYCYFVLYVYNVIGLINLHIHYVCVNSGTQTRARTGPAVILPYLLIPGAGQGDSINI